VLVETIVPWVKRTDGKRAGLEAVLMGRILIEGRRSGASGRISVAA
jgi:hypothetical protein